MKAVVTRRSNGEGSICQRADGRWVAQVTLDDGRRRALYGRTRHDVAAKLGDALKLVESGLAPADGRLTVEQFLQTWLASHESKVRQSTWEGYDRYLRKHVYPRIGRKVLGKLRPIDLEILYRDLMRKPSPGLSSTSVRQAHAILHKAFEQAVRWGEVPRNIADLVDAPRRRHRPMLAFGPDEAARLLRAAREDPLEAVYVLAVTTGMRQGELLALRWRDVDLDGGRLGVRATLLRTAGGVGLAEPKTAGSSREIELSVIAIDALRRHRAAQVEARLLAGSAWEEADFVFTNAVGRPINASNLLTRSWQPLLKRAGVQRVRFHDLRHTAATLLLGRGVHPKVVSEMLGHSTIAITLDLYSHVTKTMGQMAAREMDALFS